jgi:hypothetical protein
MDRFWSALTYSDGARIALRAEKCTSTPNGLLGTHTCRRHNTHDSTHRCICGKQWDNTGKVTN